MVKFTYLENLNKPLSEEVYLEQFCTGLLQVYEWQSHRLETASYG